MSATRPLASTVADPFRGTATLEGDVIRAELSGIADLRATTPLDQLLTSLHAEAVKAQIAEIVIDVCRLEFLSSSCVLKLVGWLGRRDEAGATYKVRFICTTRHHWQQRSLHALRAFAPDALTIETRRD
jgi:hypothetical protein